MGSKAIPLSKRAPVSPAAAPTTEPSGYPARVERAKRTFAALERQYREIGVEMDIVRREFDGLE